MGMGIKRLKIGDIFCVSFEGYNKFFQFCGRDSECLYSDVIRIFKGRYESKVDIDVNEIVDSEACIYLHTSVSDGIKYGYWQRVAHMPITDDINSIKFRCFHTELKFGLIIKNWKDYSGWSVWYFNVDGSWHYTKANDTSHVDAYPGELYPIHIAEQIIKRGFEKKSQEFLFSLDDQINILNYSSFPPIAFLNRYYDETSAIQKAEKKEFLNTSEIDFNIIKRGDIFRMDFDGFTQYFQLYGNDCNDSYGDVIKLFNRKFLQSETPLCSEIANIQEYTFIHTIIRTGIYDKTWEKYGYSPIADNNKLIRFRAFHPELSFRDNYNDWRLYSGWSVWYMDVAESFHYTLIDDTSHFEAYSGGIYFPKFVRQFVNGATDDSEEWRVYHNNSDMSKKLLP